MPIEHAFAQVGPLRVVLIPNPRVERAHIAWYGRVGSRFESATKNGISHFLEHMMYRGTPSLPRAHDVNLAFEELGGSLYAATQVDYGVFSVTAPRESLAAIIPLFADVLTRPTFRDIDVERGIVSEEILEDLDDEGNDVNADNRSRRLIYPSHALGFTITGTLEHVRGFTEADLASHHARHYNAENAVLAVAGAFDPDAVRAELERAFADVARGPRYAAVAPTHTQSDVRLEFVPNASSQMELRISFRAIAEADPRRPVIDMLLRILDDGMSTRLYHRISDSQGLCYDVSANYDGYEDDGILDFAASVNHERAYKVVREILALMEELGEQGPTDAELARAKRRNAWDTRALVDSPEEAAGFFAGGLLFERFETPDERLAHNLAVTREQVRDLARELGQRDRLNIIAVGDPTDTQQERIRNVVSAYRRAT